MSGAVIAANQSRKTFLYQLNGSFSNNITSTIFTATDQEIFYMTYFQSNSAAFTHRIEVIDQFFGVQYYLSTAANSYNYNQFTNSIAGNGIEFMVPPEGRIRIVGNAGTGTGTYTLVGYSVKNSP